MATEQTAGWNFAEIWEHQADRFPDATVQISGDRSFTWREFDRRADGIAATFLAAGVVHQDKVAHYLYNAPEYLESMFGLYKAALVPVNTNYRYTDDEIVYLWDNADAVGVIFHGTFVDRCAALRERLPAIRTWIWVDDGTGACPDWAVDYEVAAAYAETSGTGRVVPPWGRSPDDLYMLYTGGTTGMPKGVMWRQDDVIGSLDAASRQPLPTVPGWDAMDARVTKPGPRNLPAAPLMHGTGAFNAMWNLALAGAVVTMTGRSFDPIELLDTVQTHRVNSMSIVGDAFAKPILRALDAEPDRWDFSSMRVIVSSGVMWSAETKAGLLRHNARLIMIDSLGSSEAIGMANNTTSADGAGQTAKFVLTAHTKVLTDDGREVAPGSGERGRVALRGRTPIGYYKDPEKSASTFVTFEGVRWSIPGDFAEVEADGTVKLLGRGSQCINTGGEKVYPEEVEEALKLHPSVADAAVVGLPDERFGEAITALVEPADGATIDEAALILHVKTTLAAYKAPKRVLEIDTIGRAANGKLDYRRLKAFAESATAPPTR
ncbi:MAG: fatty-acid--CoA ligase [Ilumatobacteraceae bacterium]|nr:fatty-acid--CoA ligase [Ilumatobacteraceae bacterium]